jgi:large subunit ribosomal protein L11
MAKELRAKLKLQLAGGAATPAPPVGSKLSQYQVNIMDFCKQFNAKTAAQKGETIRVEISVYKDKSFDFVLKSAPTAELIKKRINISKGASKVGQETVGQIAWKDIEEIAKVKMADLNANDLEQAKKIVAGSARSMGVKVV